MSYNLSVSIGGIGFRLVSEDFPLRAEDPDGMYEGFLDVRLPGEREIRVEVRRGLPEAPVCGEKIFDAGGLWSLWRSGVTRRLDWFPRGAPVRIVADFGAGEAIRLHVAGVGAGAEQAMAGMGNPLRYPVDQVLLMYLLQATEGLIVHACGACRGAGGGVLAGVSGAGKSTIARMLSRREGFDLLSDDRVIVRLEEGRATLWGTPWRGDAGMGLNRHGPLSALFFLTQSKQAEAIALTPAQAMPRLLPVLSVPWFDAEPMARSLALCSRLLERVPAYELRFPADASAAGVVETVLADLASR